ncbi:MAG: DUF420 domain-containing protein [Acidimicrobiales bacterium]|nr:DUF420 domain-containing protein [Acidimicrobiales bacterium]
MADVSVRVPMPAGVARRLDMPVRRALPIIIALSGAVIAGLMWLVYGVEGGGDGSRSALPLVNAALNATAAVCLFAGWRFVRAGRLVAHRNAMLAGVGASGLFLTGYVLHHALHGDTPFGAHGALAWSYGALLAVHVVLSTLGLPAILTTLWASMSGRVDTHCRIARVTLPVWLTVSVTGVAVALLLRYAG